MSAIKVSKDEFFELLDDAEEIDQGKWRHGSTARFLIQRDGKHYAVWVQIHPEDGMQVFGDVTLTEVRAVEKTVTVWEAVK